MRRRWFLKAATLFLAMSPGAAAAAARSGAVAPDDEALALAERLLAAYPRRASLRAIGEAHIGEDARLEGGPEPELETAVADVLTHLDLAAVDLRRMPPAAVRESIRVGTAGDFAAGRTVSVRGWLLGETEAKLCRIAALCVPLTA